MSSISVQITRRVKKGHLQYKMEGNFKPLPCGSLVENDIRDFFRKHSGSSKAEEGLFFRLLNREEHGVLHASLYSEFYMDKMGSLKADAPDRQIKFIDLKPVDQLYHAIKDSKKGTTSVREEYENILGILNKVEDSEDVVLIEL